MLYVIGYKDKTPEKSIIINTTSHSTNWSKGLSPFILPGGKLYGNYSSLNVENAYQFSRVYKEHLDEENNIKPEYFKWATKGWQSNFTYRYPMGKDTKPEFTYWDGERLDYITARKKVYVPLYARSLIKSSAYKQLKTVYNDCNKKGIDLYLLDFDGYNHIEDGITIKDVINDPTKTMGHAFVI